MKKIACLAAVLCLAAMLTACGGKTAGSESTQTASAEKEPASGTSSAVEETVSEQAESSDPAEIGTELADTSNAPDTDPVSEESAAVQEPEEQTNEAGSEDTADGAVPAEAGAKGRLLYMGHASLRITSPEGKVIYIDPFAGQGYEPAADLILVTHSHYDHYNLDKVANRNPDCRIITWQEALSGGTHQTFDLGFASVEAVEAGNNQYHSLEECVGYIVTLTDGTSVYVSGDTSTTQQMASLAEKELDYAFYCCDGIYNMDLEEAAQCAELVGAKHNIPYHMIAADSGSLFDRSRAEQFDVPNLLIIEDGQEIELE